MKKGLILFLSFYPFLLYAENPESLDKKINRWVEPATGFISDIVFFSIPVGDQLAIPVILIWLLMAGLFFTFYMRFINVTCFRHAIRVTSGAFHDVRDKGEVSHFQALSAALSGTLGLGNISGVAIAITLGGPGATVWMIVAGLIGMCSKFTECTLGVKYREIDKNGVVSGGPMYYLSKGFAKHNMKGLGKFFAGFFAVMCVGGAIGGGNMFQSNQAARQIIHVSGSSFLADHIWLIGLFMAVCVGVVIIGGIRSIARVAELLVPFMCGIYILACLAILAYHYEDILPSLGIIVKNAFHNDAIKGGIVGVMLQGFQRASFSNEAGIGSASIAHSAVRTKEPVSEGMVGLLEPFIDTVVVCTMTALVIVITGFYQTGGRDGIELTSKAFESVISWFPYVLAVVVFLFAYATMLSWSYYGSKSWNYLFGNGQATDLTYKILFCVCVVIGASMDLRNVITFSDAMIFAMSFPNIAGLYLLAPEVKQDLFLYLQKLRK